MDFLKALKIAASASDRPIADPSAKPPVAGASLWLAGYRSSRAARAPFATELRGIRRSPVRAVGLAEAARAMMRRAALRSRG